MLVLSRKPGEKLVIDSNITITVVEVVGNRVRLALDAPPHVRILRSELLEQPRQAPAAPPARASEPVRSRDTRADPCLEVIAGR
jgi:carbon storage regulator